MRIRCSLSQPVSACLSLSAQPLYKFRFVRTRIQEIVLKPSVSILLFAAISCSGAPGPEHRTERTEVALSVAADLAHAFVADCVAMADAARRNKGGAIETIAETRRQAVALVETAEEGIGKFGSALADELASASCQSRPREHLAAFAFVMAIRPSVATTKAIDCIVESSSSEDSVLWDVLDAWRRIGRPRSMAVSGVQSRAIASSTLMKFMSPAQLYEYAKGPRPTTVVVAKPVSDDGVGI